MQDPAKQKKFYDILYKVFAVAGLVWIVGGFVSIPRHYVLFPLIGLVNWAVAWYCKQMSKAG
jgi:hypothetical protein